MTKEIKPTKNPYPEPTEHPVDSPELDEGDLHNAWNEGYTAGTMDIAKIVAKYVRGEFVLPEVTNDD